MMVEEKVAYAAVGIVTLGMFAMIAFIGFDSWRQRGAADRHRAWLGDNCTLTSRTLMPVFLGTVVVRCYACGDGVTWCE